jgi:hypothetical protein
LTWQKLQEEIESSIVVQDEWLEKLDKVKDLKPIDPIRSAFAALDSTQQISIGMTERLSDTFVQAGIAGQNMGEAVETALKSIAAQIISQAIVFQMVKSFFAPGTLGVGFGQFLTKSFGIGHTGGKVTDNGVQRFANGGMVRGKDDVPILAQAGEFIMKRDSVNSIGLDQLRQMNETGQASNVNLHFSGPITNADYVRDVIAPEIQKVIGRNLA